MMFELIEYIRQLAPEKIFALFLITICIICIIKIIHLFTYDSWPETTGKIIASKIASSNSMDQNTTSYSSEIIFEYTINKKTYTSNKNFFMLIMQGGGSGLIQRQIAKYPVGKEVNIIYHHKKHHIAYLSKPNWLTIVGSCILTLTLLIPSVYVFIQ